VFADLPRGWWFARLPGYRVEDGPSSTYNRFDLDAQPAVLDRLRRGWGWLANRRPAALWAITQDDDGEDRHVLASARLDEVVGHHPVDPALRSFVERPELQRLIRSCTGCHLDLGDFAVPIAGAPGVLCHVLSDQQWARHWLVWCADGQDRGTVLTSTLPYGFDTGDWYPDEVPGRIDALAGSDLEVCADSFEEFCFRFWIENELHFASHDGDVSPDVQTELAWYGERLRAGGSS